MTRRAALGALGAVGGVAALGAVLWPGGGGGGVPRGRVELRYWEKWTGAEGAAMARVVEKYNQSQDRAWVRMLTVSDITSKAMVAIGGGDPPDVVGLYTYSVPIYAEARAVMALDEFARGAVLARTPYLPAVRSLLEHDGHTWAGVNTIYTLALYANARALRGAGIARPARTLEELDEHNRRLTSVGADGRIERAGFLQNVPGWWPYFWPCVSAGSLYDEKTRRATIDSDACARAYAWVQGTAGEFGAERTRAFAGAFARSIHSASDPFISGRQAMIVQGPWLAAFAKAANPALEYTVAPVPVEARVYEPELPTGLLEADVLMIPRGCPHPEEAFDFLLFTQRPEVQEELALAHAKPSPMSVVSPGFAGAHPNPGVAVHAAIAASPRVSVLPRTRVCKQYTDLTIPAFEAIWSGADVTAELSRVAALAQEQIDHDGAMRARREGARA